MDFTTQFEKNIDSELVQYDPSLLDLVFTMDCTGSMGAYIDNATKNIRFIVDEIINNEKSDIRLALIQYRDHPPQDSTFVTCVHDFTCKVEEMKQWLEQCQAQGGGDTPEAVADALHDVLTLSWRPEATKICILISDAPPHGLNSYDDTFPNGCPLGFDPIKIVREMAEKHITLYTVGVEPSILPYRDFFMSLAYSTGGQYIPLVDATLLAQVIIGGVREEISLDRLMQDAQQDIANEIKQAEQDGINEREMTMRINHILTSKNKRVKQMHNTFGVTSNLVEEYYSKCVDMHQMKSIYKMTKTTQENKMDEISYALKEDNVTVEQTKRLIQKVKNRKLVKSTTIKPNVDETTTEKQTKENKRNNQRQDYDNSRLRKRRLKDGAIDILINAEDNYQEDQKEGILHDDGMMKTKQLQDQ
ncbi:unnamed protein product, partial [Rotaria sordida]